MESAYPLDENFSSAQSGLTGEIKEYLKETAKWGNFLAIVGFVFVGLMVLLSIFMGTIGFGLMSSTMGDVGGLGVLGGGFIMVFYILIAALYLIPCLYLFRFSTKMKAALENDDQMNYNQAFSNLKSMFKFWGIFTAIFVGLYALGILMALVGGAGALMF